MTIWKVSDIIHRAGTGVNFLHIIEIIAIAVLIIASATIVGKVLHTTGINIEHATTEQR